MHCFSNWGSGWRKGEKDYLTILVALTILLVIWGIGGSGYGPQRAVLFLIGLIFSSIIVPCWLITLPLRLFLQDTLENETQEIKEIPERGKFGFTRFLAGFILGRLKRK